MSESSHLLSCEGTRRALYEALGATGLPEEAARHLRTCEACGREADDIERLASQLRGMPVEEPPAAFWEHLPGRVLERARVRRHPWALTALAAAALLMLAIVPAERERRSPRPELGWLAEVAATDSWSDPLSGVRSAEEAARVLHRVTSTTGFGPGTIQGMIRVVEEESIHRREPVVWNLLDTLGPAELRQVLARLEKGADR